MLNKKTKTRTTEPCHATASGGALTCVLDKGHAGAHSTSSAGRKSMQHATWTTNAEGGITVTTYSRGKKVGGWPESVPAGEPAPKPKEPSLTDKCQKCGHELGEHDGRKCPKPEKAPCGDTMAGIACTQPKGHRGDHVGKGGTWTRDRKSARFDCAPEHDEREDDDDDPLDDEIRSDEEREFARKQREAREAHARELENTDTAMATDGNGTQGDPASPSEDSGFMKQTAGRHLSEGPKILGYRRHPAAALFPLLEGEAFDRFADRIQASGLRDPIVRVTVGGETFILDGSNRGMACEQRGITPRFVDYEGPKDMASLVAYSVDKNGDGRRHLDPSVRAMIALEAATLGRGNPGNRETGGAAGLTQAEAGKRLGVGERLVRKAKVVRDKGTAKVREAVMSGKLTVEAAEHVTKLPAPKQDEIADEALAKKSGAIKSGRVRALVKQEEKRAVVRKINDQRVPPAPIAAYRLFVVDPPWPYDNSDQHEGSRGHISYPPMSIDDICRMRVDLDRLAHPTECILGLWVTNAFIHEVGRVLAAWGFTHRTMYTWDKELEGVGTWGRGRTEHLVIASRGEVVHTLNEISTLLSSRRREHSRKPDEMYELLAKHCPGPRIDMFARESRESWATWGAEAHRFDGKAA